MRKCEHVKNDTAEYSPCELGHINSSQCKNFHSHIKFFKTEGQLRFSIMREEEKDYIRKTFKED